MLKAVAGPVVSIKTATLVRDGAQHLYDPAEHAREIVNPTDQGIASSFLKPLPTIPRQQKQTNKKTNSSSATTTAAAASNSKKRPADQMAPEPSASSSSVDSIVVPPPRGTVSQIERRKLTKRFQVDSYKHN
jgi:hypothetical protein